MSDKTGTRKPYRISKPREKWTDKEHERFVNAINQHGRNWKRIVLEVGTRTVAQVRSHAQKYFLKLEKNGNWDDVPPARAKRPSTKAHPSKASNEEGSSLSGQSSQVQETKRPRRTERVSTRPVRSEFTFLEDDAAVSPEPGSSGDEPGHIHEGKSSNNVGGSTESFQTGNRQSTAISPMAGGFQRLPSMPSVSPNLSPHPNVYSESTLMNDDLQSPTDESSAGAIQGSPLGMGDYSRLYNPVNRFFSHQSSNILPQYGSSTRSDYTPLLDQYHSDAKGSLAQRQSSNSNESSPPTDDSHFNGHFQSPGYPAAAAPGLPPLHSGASTQLLNLDPVPDVPVTQANTQGTGLLPSCTQPSELDQSGWRLAGLSGDLNTFLAPGSTDIAFQHGPSMIDSPIFDY